MCEWTYEWTPLAQSMMGLNVGGMVVILAVISKDMVLIRAALAMMVTMMIVIPIFLTGNWLHTKREIHRKKERV